MRQVLPPGTTHLLPVLDRSGTGGYPALGLGDLGRLCLGMLLQFLQMLLSLFERVVYLQRAGKYQRSAWRLSQ